MTISYYNGNTYKNRSESNQFAGFLLASAASSAILSPLVYAGRAVEKHVAKEQVNTDIYKDALYKSLEHSGLKEKGVEIIPAQLFQQAYPTEAAARNAFYSPDSRKIVINTEKMAIAGLHELGHARNHLKSIAGKVLQKMRLPGYAIAGLMEYFALFSRTKPKEANKSLTDRIEDNCGLIAFLAMLPIAAEEALASHNGVEFAKKAGLSKNHIKNLKAFQRKAWLTYGGRAALGGLAVATSRWIMDKFTRPKKIETDSFFF